MQNKFHETNFPRVSPTLEMCRVSRFRTNWYTQTYSIVKRSIKTIMLFGGRGVYEICFRFFNYKINEIILFIIEAGFCAVGEYLKYRQFFFLRYAFKRGVFAVSLFSPSYCAHAFIFLHAHYEKKHSKKRNYQVPSNRSDR